MRLFITWMGSDAPLPGRENGEEAALSPSDESKLTPAMWLYGGLAVAGAAIPWYFNLEHISAGGGIAGFVSEGFLTAATSSITVDVLVAAATFFAFVVYESRRIGMSHAWAYVLVALVVAFACAFPLFLLMRERHVRRSSPRIDPRPRRGR